MGFALEGSEAEDAIPLLQPLPVTTDVNSPEFSYEHFANGDHDVAEYSPKVERERVELVEHRQPSGVIAERLVVAE
ncbi:hypothetical protein ACOBQX_16615 [Actinokineospora sp. G85]|uniref:hypothetical protein n=1 Tax=Actinokineospora sp. G85 TaxID=3406626 RepID=UPI003C70EDB9